MNLARDARASSRARSTTCMQKARGGGNSPAGCEKSASPFPALLSWKLGLPQVCIVQLGTPAWSTCGSTYAQPTTYLLGEAVSSRVSCPPVRVGARAAAPLHRSASPHMGKCRRVSNSPRNASARDNATTIDVGGLHAALRAGLPAPFLARPSRPQSDQARPALELSSPAYDMSGRSDWARSAKPFFS